MLQRVVSTSSTRPSATESPPRDEQARRTSNAVPNEVARESVTFPAEAATFFFRTSGTCVDEKSDIRWG